MDERQKQPEPPAEGLSGRWVLLGQVGVDSARLGVIDPMLAAEADYQSDDDLADPALFGDFAQGAGVQFQSGLGDGSYAVWGWVVDYGAADHLDERIAQVTITLIDETALRRWREAMSRYR